MDRYLSLTAGATWGKRFSSHWFTLVLTPLPPTSVGVPQMPDWFHIGRTGASFPGLLFMSNLEQLAQPRLNLWCSVVRSRAPGKTGPARPHMMGKTVALLGQTASQHFHSDRCTGAIGPALNKPSQEPKTVVPELVEAHTLELVPMEESLSFFERRVVQNAPSKRSASATICCEVNESERCKLGAALTFTVKQRRLQLRHSRMRERTANG